jgi:PAS domain S-box-containing protein
MKNSNIEPISDKKHDRGHVSTKERLLLFSESLTTIAFVRSAVNKLEGYIEPTVVSLDNDNFSLIENESYPVVIIDRCSLDNISKGSVKEMIHFHKEISFILVYPNGQDEEVLEWFRVGFSEIVTHDNPLSLALSIAREIKVRDKVRSTVNAKIKKYEADLSTIFSNTHICFVYLDTRFNFISVNEAYAKSTGHPVEYFVGKNHFDLYPHAENQAIFQKVVDTGEPYTVFAKPFSFPDHPEWGTTYWDWSLKPLRDRNDKISGLLFSLVDVTENIRNQQKLFETELLYTNIFSVLTEGVIVFNKNGEIVIGNPSAEKLLDIKRGHQSSEKPCLCVNEELVEMQDCNLPANITLRTGVPCKNMVIGLPVGKRDYQWLSINTQPIFYPDTTDVFQVVVSITDITESKKMEKEIATKKRMEVIGDLAGRIVHDLNNVLQPIVLLSDLLKIHISKLAYTEQIGELGKLVDKIHVSTNRGKEMVSQILNYAKNLREGEPLHVVDLVKAIQETLDDIQLISVKNVIIVFQTKLKTANILAGKNSIHQIISNLCNNSIYAMKGKVTGTLSIHLDQVDITDKLKNRLKNFKTQFAYRIRLRDDGHGIKQGNLEKIFDPFFSTKQRDGGTGLGLSSVHTIVQNLGGSISVVSKENVGTRFSIYFPCV